MTRYTALLLASMLLARPSRSFPDPVFSGSEYLITSEATSYYLACGTDTLCSNQPVSGAAELDGWIVNSIGSYWQFIGHDGIWALGVQNEVQKFSQQTGEKVFANTDTDVTSGQHPAQLWALHSWPDGSYQIQNVHWNNGALDVNNSVTPFVNVVNDDPSLSGQYWWFLSVQPQVTTTVFTTITQTVNSLAASTVTVTTTMCPNKRAHVNGTPLHKRQATGSAILDTTTNTFTSTITTTTTQTGDTILTSTEFITSCAPVTQVSVATATNTVVSVSNATRGGIGLTAGAPGITATNTQSAPTSITTTAKQGAADVFQPCTVLSLLLLVISVIGPAMLF